MTCVGLGVDIVGVEEFSRIVEKRGQRLLDRLFTPAERDHCEGKQSRIESYTARFAAKEAYLKAIGQGLRGGMSWKEIEVINDELGKPKLNISGKAREIANRTGVNRLNLSLSHSDGFAIAVVFLED